MAASTPTPPELDALAGQARRLAAAIENAQAGLLAIHPPPLPTSPPRRAAGRLADAAGLVRRAADVVDAIAAELAFVESVRGRPHCGADWGCCPEHGATLASSGGRTWCTASSCRRVWDWDRLGLPCDEPPAFRLVDTEGTIGLVCAGHAIAARKQLAGGRLLPIEGPADV